MNVIQTILHPTDFSASADWALRLACSLCRDHEARLVVLHISPSAAPMSGDMMAPASFDLADEEERNFMEHMESMKHDHPEVPIECRMGRGDVVNGILEAAKVLDAGLIAMGTHGRTGLRRLVMGSVAENVVRKAPCSVKEPIAKPHSADSFTDRPMLATPY